jgi:plastocyanin
MRRLVAFMFRPLPVAALTFTLLLAGCTSPPAADVTPTSDQPGGTNVNAGNTTVTASPNGTSVRPGNATVSANGTALARPPISLSVAASGIYPVNPAFDPATLSATTGSRVNLTFSNGDSLPINGHNWVLEGVEGAETAVINPGETVSIEFIAPAPGEYAYFCSVGNHRDLGMEGLLTVS